MMVKKQSETQWKVEGFTNFYKACPKDSFLFLRIDQLVDAITRHEIFTFMDAYSGYNQIEMYPPDREKTYFIIDKGLYYYNVMSFGLKNVGATY